MDTVHTIFIVTDIDLHPHVMSGTSSTWGVIQGRLLSIRGSWNTTKTSSEIGGRTNTERRGINCLERWKNWEDCNITNLEKNCIVIFRFAPSELNILKHILEKQNFQVSLAYIFIKFKPDNIFVIISTVCCYFYINFCIVYLALN